MPDNLLGFAGINSGANLVNAGFNQLFANYNRKQNFHYNEKAAVAADNRQRQQFKDLYSFSAQLEEMKKAGLSPSMMYGGTPSQGGATAPQGAGVGGLNVAPTQLLDPMSAAQIGLIQAETEKVKEETKTEAGTNEKGQTMISLMTSEISEKLASAGYMQTSAEFNKAQTTFQNIQNKFAEPMNALSIESLRVDIQKSIQEAEFAKYSALREGLQYKFDVQAFDTNFESLKAGLAKLIADTDFTIARKKEAMAHASWYQADEERIAESILQGWKKLEIEDADQKAKQNFLEAKARDIVYQRNYNERRFDWEKGVKEKEIDLARRQQNLNFTVDLLHAYAANMSNAVGFIQAIIPWAGKGSALGGMAGSATRVRGFGGR